LLLSANLGYTNCIIIIIIIITLIEANALPLSQTANQSAGSPKCSGFILLSAWIHSLVSISHFAKFSEEEKPPVSV